MPIKTKIELVGVATGATILSVLIAWPIGPIAAVAYGGYKSWRWIKKTKQELAEKKGFRNWKEGRLAKKNRTND